MNRIKSTQVVSAPLAEVFEFFDKPANLAAMTPGWLGFEILTPAPVLMTRGAIIDYAISLGPIPTRWRSMITSYEPPYRFVDEQMLGPYSFWHHTHRFSTVEGGTLVEDEVRYLLPLGWLGEVAHSVMVKGQLQKIFQHRQKYLAERFNSEIEGLIPLEFSRL